MMKQEIPLIKNHLFYKIDQESVDLKDLSKELIKANQDNNQIISTKKEINDNKKNNDILRLELNKELQDKNLEYALEKDQKEELIIKLDELNESIKELKEERDYNKRIEIANSL